MNILLLISALSLSSIAAYFSIIGLATIFPGSISSVITMAIGLEVAKIVVAVWTHQNWKKISFLSKSYLSFAIIILMGITSMGIFGFLSKSHIEHSSSVSFSSQEINEINRKISLKDSIITRNKEYIENEKKTLSFDDVKNKEIKDQLSKDLLDIQSRSDLDIKNYDDKIEKLNSRSSELDNIINEIRKEKGGFFSNTASKIKKIEEQQKEERNYISNQISKLNDLIFNLKEETKTKVNKIRSDILSITESKSQVEEKDFSKIRNYESNIAEALSDIENLNLKKFELENKILLIENELGPIKYISSFIEEVGGPKLDGSSSVRLVILFIIFVFDPLAIVMVVCASSSFFSSKKQDLPKEDPPKQDPPKEDPPKEDPPKEDPPKQDPPKEDSPKQDSHLAYMQQPPQGTNKEENRDKQIKALEDYAKYIKIQ